MSTINNATDVTSNKRNETLAKPIKLGGHFFDIDMRNFGIMISKAIIQSSCTNLVNLDDLVIKLKIGNEENLNKISTLEDAYNVGFSIFDYYFYRYFKDMGKEVKIIYVEDKNLGTFTEYMKDLTVCYFLLMTRGKILLSENEVMPKFITDFCNYKKSSKELLASLSDNDITKLNHSWIKEIDIMKLSRPFMQRLSSGIAGARLFNIFKSFTPKELNVLSPELGRVYSVVRNISLRGPFYEMHPFFMPLNLSNLSVSKNLLNLILDIYTKDEVEALVNNRSLFDFPKYDSRYIQYLTWDSKTFQGFTNPVVRE